MKFFRIAATLAALFVLPVASASAQSLLNEQAPVPFGTAGAGGQSDLFTQSINVSGGTLQVTVLKQPGSPGLPIGVAQTFIPAATGGRARFLPLTNGKSDLGVPMTAAAGTPTGTLGVSRTAGTSLVLVGEATSSSAKTNKALWEFTLPDSYVAGQNIAVVINQNYVTTGTVTAAATTLTPVFYLESATGGETSQTITAAQQMTVSATNLTFTVTGTSLTPGARVVLEVTMLVTTSAGAATGQINSISFNG